MDSYESTHCKEKTENDNTYIICPDDVFHPRLLRLLS